MVTDHEMRMEALRLFEENGKLRNELNDLLEVVRSAHEIAKREGSQTNWEGFRNRAHAAILKTASALSSQDRGAV